MRDIGKNIRDIRKAKGMTQDGLAASLFVTRQTVSNYENGKSRPDLDMLLRISQVLQTDVNTIFYGPPVPQSKKDGYRWIILSGCVLAALAMAYGVLYALFPKESHWGWQHQLRVVNQLVMLPAVMFTLGWFMTHCLSLSGNLQQLRADRIKVARIIVATIFSLLALIPVPMVIFYIVAAYKSCAYDSVSMTFPYIPVYREAFMSVLYMIDRIPFVYILFGSVAWLLGLPKVQKT